MAKSDNAAMFFRIEDPLPQWIETKDHPGQLRWWDGEQWTTAFKPIEEEKND